MNILVTGGCGFIGTRTVENLLKRGDEITIIDKTPAGFDKKSAKIISADISSGVPQIQGDFGALVHLAAKSDARNMQDFRLFKEINIDGTLNILEMARKKDISRVIFASSSHVYGEKREPRFRETGTINPVSYYGATKFLGETICCAYSDFYGISCAVLRLFTVYGPRGRTDMAAMKFIQSIDRGETISVHGGGKIKKDFVYVDDVSEAIIKSLGAKMKFEIINIGSGKATELLALISMAENELGRQAKKVFVPMQAGDVAYSCASIDKAKRLLKWAPKVQIKEGIKKTVDWYRSQAKK